MDFNKIVGHERAIDVLKKSIKRGNISHSYLFEGEEGIGKRMVAYAFSKTLLCNEKGDEPCNQCRSCQKFDKGVHPDFFLIEPEKNLIKVKQIERVINEMYTAPFESNRKLFIINDSHKMNTTSANRLLKTLEEPPAFAHIILVSSNPDSMLETILSRLHNIKFFPLKASQIRELLVKRFKKSEDEANFIAAFTKGGMGRSTQLASNGDFLEKRDRVIDIIDSLIKGDKSKVFSSITFFNDNKDRINDILDIFLYWFRDLLVYKETSNTELLVNRDKLDRLSKQRHMKLNKINDIIVGIDKTKQNIGRNVNFQLAIETMLLNI